MVERSVYDREADTLEIDQAEHEAEIEEALAMGGSARREEEHADDHRPPELQPDDSADIHSAVVVETTTASKDNEVDPPKKTVKKKVEPCLLKYVQERRCRRTACDEIYENPPREGLFFQYYIGHIYVSNAHIVTSERRSSRLL